MLESIHIMRTVFQSLDESGKVISEGYGVRVYGEGNVAYCGFVHSREKLMEMSPEELVDFARRINDQVAGLVHFAENGGCPIYIDSQELTPYVPIFK